MSFRILELATNMVYHGNLYPLGFLAQRVVYIAGRVTHQRDVLLACVSEIDFLVYLYVLYQP